MKFTQYKQSCPHCGNTITSKLSSGENYYIPEIIGNPIRECPNCHKTYFNRNVQEYAAFVFTLFDEQHPQYDKNFDEKLGYPLKKIALDPLYIYEFSEFYHEKMAPLNLNNEKANGLLENPHALAESFIRLNNFDHAKRLYDLDHRIPIFFLREVYYCPECYKLVGRETRGEKYCSTCNTQLIPSGIHIYEWNSYPVEMRTEIKKSWGIPVE